MENPGKHESLRRSRRRPPTSQSWTGSATALLPVLACFLGGATAKWAEGIVLALFGILLVVAPPRFSLGRSLNSVALGVIGCSAIAFLPARWFFQPDWRAALVHDFGIAIPSTLSPQPWVSLGYLLSFVGALSWLYYVCTRQLETREVRREIRLFGLGIASLAGLCLFLYLRHTTLPIWHNERNFGPFPNRNQTADLLGISAVVILACAYEDFRNRRKRWLLWVVGFAFVIAAIVLDFSRAGIVLLIAGAGAWLGSFALRRGAAARIAIGGSLLLVLLTVLLLFGGQTLERFHLRGTSVSGGMSSELRWLIFRDAWQLIKASPWCGIGLGNFDAIFAVFRDASRGDARALHPESDWLWFWAEAGWPALLLVIAGTGLLLRRCLPIGEEKNGRLRAAGAIAVSLFALHGFVDVSAHRVGTAWSAIFLLSLAFRRPLLLAPSAATVVIFRVIGLVLILAGASWTAAERWHLPLAGSVGAENAYAAAAAASREQNYEETIAQTSRALAWTPLDWHLYFLRALGKVGAKYPAGDALDDFRRARFLEPNAIDVPFEEGRAWLPGPSTLTLIAWREALRRAGPERAAVYDRMLALAQQFRPEIIARLQDLGSAHHELALIYLARTNGAHFAAALDALLERDPDLRSFNADEKAKIFMLWGERGDLSKLADAVAQHPEWAAFSWRTLANEEARKRDFSGAIGLVRRFCPAPSLPNLPVAGTADELQRTLANNPRNYAIGFALYQKQKEEGKNSDALITVHRLAELEGSPPYFRWLESACWADDGNAEQAWNAWQKFETATRRP